VTIISIDSRRNALEARNSRNLIFPCSFVSFVATFQNTNLLIPSFICGNHFNCFKEMPWRHGIHEFNFSVFFRVFRGNFSKYQSFNPKFYLWQSFQLLQRNALEARNSRNLIFPCSFVSFVATFQNTNLLIPSFICDDHLN
jgi:hypothetical protein